MRWYHIFAMAAGVLFAAILLTVLLIVFGVKAEEDPADPLVPPVEYLVATAAPHRLSVRAQGVVSASTETTLIPEVSGRIIEVSPRFDAGGFFEEGDMLLRIEETAHLAALAEAEARLAAARLALAQEEAASEQAEQDWQELNRGRPSELARREPQRAQARAEIAAAEAAVVLARRNLDRAVVKAPFPGRVRETRVGLGEVVTANSSQLAALYGVETAEVRLPLTLREIGLLELPESYRGERDSETGPAVVLEGEYGGERYRWEGTVERVEGVIDPRTRLVYAVAVVYDPYRRDAQDDERPPLKVGLFVEAEITGKLLESAFVLPRALMVGLNELYVIDPEDRLHRRQVQVAHADWQSVVIVGGLAEGERVNRTPIDFFIEGMKVDPRPASPQQSDPP